MWSELGSVAIAVSEEAYWGVDLGEEKTLNYIDMRGMENMHGYDHSMNIKAMVCPNADNNGCTQCGGRQTTPMRGWIHWDCDGVEGRYVRLEYSHSGHNWHFCRVMVFGKDM